MLEQAIKLFEERSYLESFKLIQKYLNSEKKPELKAFEILYSIDKKLKQKTFSKSLNDFLHALYRENNFSRFCQICKENQKHLIKIENRIFHLKALWRLGKIKDFFEETKAVFEYILEKKIYSQIHSVSSFVLEKAPYWLVPHFAQMVFYVEMNDNQSLAKISAHLRELISKRWSKIENKQKTRIEYCSSVIEILNDVEVKDIEVELEVYRWKLYRTALSDEVITKKEILETLILFSEEIESLVMVVKSIEVDQENLVNYIKRHPNYTPKLLGLISEREAKLFKPKKYKMEKSEISQEDEELKEVDEYLRKLKKTQAEKSLPRENSPSISSAEKELIERILFRDEELLANKEVILQSLISIRFFDAAIEIIKLFESSKNKEYLKASVYFEKSQFNECIAVLNEALNKYEFDLIEKVPFLYLKAESYLNLNRLNDALKNFKDVYTIDPNFRLVKERLESASN